MNELISELRRRRGIWTVAAHQRRQDRRGEIEFVHINKTGGSSIERALGLPFSHQTASMRVQKLGVEEWNRRYSFSFVRNPWDRLVSQYHYRRSRGRLRSDLEFGPWVRATLRDRDVDLQGWSIMFMTQTARLTGRDGQLLVDDVYRFERFEADFERLCVRTGVAATLSHRKPSAHRPFAEYYDSDTSDLVADYFAADVDAFGYCGPSLDGHGVPR